MSFWSGAEQGRRARSSRLCAAIAEADAQADYGANPRARPMVSFSRQTGIEAALFWPSE
jgi:hypothetical protein